MKTLIISDLHSNIHALEAIWKKENDSDLIICAGDLIDVGPYPREVIDWIIEHEALCVKGNHDQNLINLFHKNEDLTKIDNKEMNWLHKNYEILNKEEITFLDNLPEIIEVEIDQEIYGITHAYKGYEVIIGSFAFKKFVSNIFENQSLNRIIFGHTHRQAICHVSNDQFWINPGSTSYRSYLEPDDNFLGAEYMTIIDGSINFKRLDYDKKVLNKEIRKYKGSICSKTFEQALKRFPL